MRVASAHAFGSYITDAQDLGDVDIATELERKELSPGTSWVEANFDRARASGKVFSWNGPMYGCGETEVWHILRGRSPHASLARLDVIDREDWPRRRIYPICWRLRQPLSTLFES